jgi:hypothetical protein
VSVGGLTAPHRTEAPPHHPTTVRPNKITRCRGKALVWASAVGIRGIVLFLFILALVKNRFALMAHVHLL